MVRRMNRLAEPEPLYRRALTIGDQNYGPNHPPGGFVIGEMPRTIAADVRP